MRLARVFTVVDSHTAGHPTRVVMSGVPPLRGETVLAKRDQFRRDHDSLRPLLLHEPRGHAAMVMAVPVESRMAPYGLFFVSSYAYLDMCGHATIGYVATLAATGALVPKHGATLEIETPAGVVRAALDVEGVHLAAVRLRNVPCRAGLRDKKIQDERGKSVVFDLAYGGAWFAIIDAGQYDELLAPDATALWCRRGAALKIAINSLLEAERRCERIGSVMFVARQAGGGRHLVVLEQNKFDRSPCGTGTSALLALLHARGEIAPGQSYRAENVLGLSFDARIAEILHGRETAVVPEIVGMAHVTAFSTFVLEGDDPLPSGFLCR
jgi:proline racemase